MSKKSKSNFIFRLLFIINILFIIGILLSYLSTHFSPNSIPYLYYFGLTYPVYLIGLLIFIIFWLFFKKKNALYSLVAIIIGFNHLTDFYALNLSKGNISEDSIKVMSYNVHIFNLYDKENKIQKRNDMFDFLKEENPSIICFQEFYHENNSTDFKTRDSLIQFIDAKNYHEQYTHEMTGQKYFGVATFTKYPIVYKGSVPFENDDNNFCIYTDVKIKADTFRIFNAHLGSIRFQDGDYLFFGDKETPSQYQREMKEQQILTRLKIAFEKRAEQIEIVMKQVQKSPYPVIFCGDLNDTPVSYCYRHITQYLTDAFIESGNGIGRTYIGKVPSNRIDYIFHSKNLKSTNFITHNVNYSDHRPISCFIDVSSESVKK